MVVELAIVSRRSLVLASLLLAAFLISLDITIVNVALPSLVRELHASNSQLQWVVDAYSLVFAALILAAGSLSDRLGRKGFLLAGLGVFGAASLAGGLTTGAGQLIAARCFMGAGAAMIFPSTLSLISNVFTERRERARAIGLWGASTGAAIALGPIVGGWLLERFSWQSIFIVMAPVAATGAVLVALSVPTSRDPRAPRIDLPGLLLSTAAMAALIYTIIEAPPHGLGSARTLGGFALAIGLVAAFIVRERTASEPMIDLRLFRNLRFSAASGSVTVAFFSLAGFIFLITQYFQFLKGYSPLAAGVRTLPVATSVAVASVLGTKLAVRFGTKLVVTAGLGLLAIFFLWVSASTVTTTYLTIAITMVICGSGMGLTSTPATEAIMGVVPKDKAGVGSAVNDATRLLGSTLGVAVIGSIYASVYSTRLSSALPRALPAGIAHAIHESVGAGLAVAAHLHASGQAPLGTAVRNVAEHAFTHGLSIGCLVAAGVSAAGAVLAGILLPAHPPRSHEDVVEHVRPLQTIAVVD
jgi:EmrB/QacA subfamily drug resistance transporter